MCRQCARYSPGRRGSIRCWCTKISAGTNADDVPNIIFREVSAVDGQMIMTARSDSEDLPDREYADEEKKEDQHDDAAKEKKTAQSGLDAIK